MMSKRIRLFMTIKREMFLLSVSSFLLVSLLISGIFLKLLYDNRSNSAKDSLRDCNSQIVTFTEGLFRENAAILELLARDDTIVGAGNGDKEAVLEIFDNVLDENDNLTYAYVGYANGSLYIRQYMTPPGFNVTRRPWYRQAIEKDGVAQLVYSDAATGVWLFSQCIRLMDKAGNVVGAVALDCSNASINRQLSSQYRYASQRSFIINPSGTVLLHPTERFINRSLPSFMSEATWRAVSAGGNYAEYELEGVPTMAYLERIPDTEFIVVTAIDTKEVMRPIIYNLVFILAIVVVICLILGLALSRVYIDRFARPIQELRGRIRNLAAGKPDPGRELGTSNEEMQSIASDIEIIVKDIANQEEKRKAAEYLSYHDSMTGLYNRRFFEEELRRLDSKRSYPLCVMCCDVNGLKLVNDVFGHPLGDQLLTTISNSLQREMRADDILARMGGDEFSMLLPCTSQEEAPQIIRRLKGALPTDGLCGAQVSISLGFAVKTQAEQLTEDIVRLADEMMYEKKTLESPEMKRKTVANIVTAAQREGLVRELNQQESQVLRFFSDALCPESEALLLESYRLRKIGLCTLLFSQEYDHALLNKRHTEMGYRLLSSLDSSRGVAACVLHYKEHWDGSGWPSGLTGMDIPLLSRIIGVTEAYLEGDRGQLTEKSGIWYDQSLVQMLEQLDS